MRKLSSRRWLIVLSERPRFGVVDDEERSRRYPDIVIRGLTYFSFAGLQRMAGGIFISYRRDDASAYARLIFYKLVSVFFSSERFHGRR